MSLQGTVINGEIVVDGGVKLPEGARVHINLDEDDIPMPPLETRQQILASLRRSIEDEKAGRGEPLDKVMAEIAAECRLPWKEPG